MKLLYCSHRGNFIKIGSDYYCGGSWPYFIPALAQFFEPMYLMVPVSHHSIPWTTKLDKAPNLKVIETKAYRNETLQFIQQSYLWSWGNVLKFRKWQAQVDVVLFAVPSTLPYLAYLPFINKPVVALVAGDEQELAKISSSSPITKIEKFTGLLKFRELLENYLLKKSAAIICLNHQFKQKLLHKYNFPESKVNILLIGIDTDMFKPFTLEQKNRIRQDLGLKDNLVIGFVAGIISHSKGADTLIAAFNQLKGKYPQVRLLLIGEDILGFERDQSIIYCGRLRKEDLPTYYNVMDIFVFPTWSEGAPKVVMEALACGIPVISTNVGGIPELIKAGETGFLVNPGDVNKIVSYCQMLLEDEGLRKRVGEKSRKYALENFDYHQLARRTADVIKSVVGSK